MADKNVKKTLNGRVFDRVREKQLTCFSDCINITIDSIVSTIKNRLWGFFLLTIPLEKSQLPNFKKNYFFRRDLMNANL